MHRAPQEIRTYFVTAVTAQRRRLFQVAAAAELLQSTLIDYRNQERFQLHAHVIMPDHFHALITPAANVSLEKSMQYVKGGFSFRYKGLREIWMKGFNESQILSAEKFLNVARYIEENPVRRNLAAAPAAYSYSSASHGRLDAMPGHLH